MFSSIARLALLTSAIGAAAVLAVPFAAAAATHTLVARATAEFLPASGELQGTWELQGCSPDPYRLNPVIWGSSFQEVDTIDECLTTCDSAGAHYCGLGNGFECYASNFLRHKQPIFPAAQLSPTSDGGCSSLARGSNTQRGGGVNFLQVYTSKQRPLPSTKPRVNSYNFDGCYSDDENSRLLPTQISSIDFYGMTLDACTAACSAQGMDQAGVSGRHECFCGKTSERDVAKEVRKWAPEDCFDTCSGDGGSFCGTYYPRRISVYRQGAAPPTPPPAPAPTNPRNPDVMFKNVKYAYDGCYATSLFSFFTFTYATDRKNSNERCVASCAARGFTYAATTNGNVCRCGNALANRKADAAACNRACPDASSQTCGGRLALSVYKRA